MVRLIEEVKKRGMIQEFSRLSQSEHGVRNRNTNVKDWRVLDITARPERQQIDTLSEHESRLIANWYNAFDVKMGLGVRGFLNISEY